MTQRIWLGTLLACFICSGMVWGQAPATSLPPIAAPPPSVEPTPQPQRSADRFRIRRGGSRGGGPGYGVVWYPQQTVSGQATQMTILDQDLSLGAPLWQSEGDMVLLTTRVRNSLFDTEAILPDTGRAFPSTLWDVKLGVNYMHKFQNGWMGGIRSTFGSASDRPFNGLAEINLGVSTFLRIPVVQDRDAWLFSLTYSPVGLLNFPVPGVAYQWNPSDTFHATLGIPFSIDWQPVEQLRLEARYTPLFNIHTQATYQIDERWTVFAGYDYDNHAYFLNDRPVKRDRFFRFEQRVTGGARWRIWGKAIWEVRGGYVFGRTFGEGQNQGSDLRDEVTITPGPYLGTSLSFQF